MHEIHVYTWLIHLTKQPVQILISVCGRKNIDCNAVIWIILAVDVYFLEQCGNFEHCLFTYINLKQFCALNGCSEVKQSALKLLTPRTVSVTLKHWRWEKCAEYTFHKHRHARRAWECERAAVLYGAAQEDVVALMASQYKQTRSP